MNQSTKNMLQPALIGGVSLGVASAIPGINLLNCACCALVIGGGFLAAYLYMKDMPPSPEPPYIDAIQIGALAGAIGAVVGTLIAIPFQLIGFGFGSLAELSEVFEDADLPPEVADLLSGVGAAGFGITILLVSFFFSLVIDVIFAMIGSLIGAAVFHKKPAAAPQVPTPPPPAAG